MISSGPAAVASVIPYAVGSGSILASEILGLDLEVVLQTCALIPAETRPGLVLSQSSRLHLHIQH